MSDLSYAPISSVPVSDTFFDTLRADYPGFDEWLKRKGTESAYVARREDGGIDGFLYLKLEDGAVTDVQPALVPTRRLKVGTLKVNPHGTYFQDATTWDEAEIAKRGEKLLEHAKRIWPRPQATT